MSEEKIEVPPGLIRMWKVWVSLLFVAIASGLGGWFNGHSYARVVEKEVRVEVQPPACHDEMLKIENDKKDYACSHPEHTSQLLERRSFGGDTTFFVCTCPHAVAADASVPK